MQSPRIRDLWRRIPRSPSVRTCWLSGKFDSGRQEDCASDSVDPKSNRDHYELKPAAAVPAGLAGHPVIGVVVPPLGKQIRKFMVRAAAVAAEKRESTR